MQSNKNKIMAVEGIRGVACAMVFMSHISSTFYPSMHTGSPSTSKGWLDLAIHKSPFAFFYSGSAAVGIFFVLSGFILSYVINAKPDISRAVSDLLVKRIFRLGIPAIASCLLAYALFHFVLERQELGQWFQSYNIAHPNLIDSIYNGSILPFLAGHSNYNWSLWTMKIELFGSIAIGILCIILSQVNHRKTIIFIFAVTPYFIGLKQNDDIYYSSFIIGCLIYNLDIKLNNASAMVIISIAIYLCGYHTNSASYLWIQKHFTLSVYGRNIDNYVLMNNIGGVLFVTAVLKNEILAKALSLKPLYITGQLSFSTYLIHMPVMFVVCPLVFNYFSATGASYVSASLASAITTIVAVYWLSFPFFKYIDSLGMKVSSGIKNATMTSEKAPQ